jgi:hypothetical protein
LIIGSMGNKYGITSYMFRRQGQIPFVCIPLGIITVERITDNFSLKKHFILDTTCRSKNIVFLLLYIFLQLLLH